MEIFLDFDDVIFNTKQFVADFKKIFSDFGVSEEVFNKHYHQLSGKNGTKLYDLDKHVTGVSVETGIDENSLKQSLNKFVEQSYNYVFSDVDSFLQQFQKQNLYLISYGENNWQYLKIKNSQIEPYFNQVVITDNLDKAEAVLDIYQQFNLPKQSTAFFLDDKLEPITSVKTAMSNIKTILVSRSEGRYHEQRNEYCDLMVTNLNEAEKIILNF